MGIMNIVPNADGWQETVTIQVNINRIRKNIILASEYTRYGTGHPKIMQQRAMCECCRLPWKETQSVWVSMVHIFDSPARMICDNCLNSIVKTFKGRIV